MPAPSIAYQAPSALVQELLAAGMMRTSTDGLALISPDGSVFASRVPAPTFDPVEGGYAAAQSVAIECDDPDADIFYTDDDSEPTRDSTPYAAPIAIPLGPDVTLKAIAVRAGMLDSAVAQADYTFTKAATPTFDPVAGPYVGEQAVTIASLTPGVTIYYTDDGTAPTNASTLYEGPVAVPASVTLKAIAYKDGLTPSAVGSAAYVIS